MTLKKVHKLIMIMWLMVISKFDIGNSIIDVQKCHSWNGILGHILYDELFWTRDKLWIYSKIQDRYRSDVYDLCVYNFLI